MQSSKMWIFEKAKANVKPAVGCTEPVAVGYLASQARKYLGGEPAEAVVYVSKNIYKNGKSVYIPGTGEAGLSLAAAIGFTRSNPGRELMVFDGLESEEISKAKELLNKGVIRLEIRPESPDVFAEIQAKRNETQVLVRLSGGHDRITHVQVNDEVIFHMDEESRAADEKPEVTLGDLLELLETLSEDEIAFVEDGIKYNFAAAEIGLNGHYGLELGRKLNEITNNPCFANQGMKAQTLTAAAADMRMGGGLYPIMTSGGSGNQGIGVVIPIEVVASDNEIPVEKRNRALVLGHMINELVKMYSGKLSGMCGCAIGAGVGSAAGITWMLGGNEEQISAACNMMFANLTGMLCDGAKDTCALKLSTCAYQAVVSAYLALSDLKLKPSVGLVGEDLGETISNVGYLSKEAFPLVDEKMLDIISK